MWRHYSSIFVTKAANWSILLGTMKTPCSSKKNITEIIIVSVTDVTALFVQLGTTAVESSSSMLIIYQEVAI